MVAEELEKCRDRDARRGAVLAAADGARVFSLGLFVPPRAEVVVVVVVVTLRRVEERANDQWRRLQFLNDWIRSAEGEWENMGNVREREGGRGEGDVIPMQTDGGALAEETGCE